MEANHIRDITRDGEYTKEGIEYCAPYWELILKHQRMTELEREMELGLLIEQRKELHRKVVENDKPGRRHMLPFVWRKRTGIDGITHDIQVPLKLGTPQYSYEMEKIEAKIKALRGR